MLPHYLHPGYMGIWPHTLCEFLAFFVSYRYYGYLKNKSGLAPLSPSAEWAVIMGGASGALIGSRLLGILENPHFFLQLSAWTPFTSSKTILGGLAGAIIGVEIAKKWIGLKRRTGDHFLYPLILGMIIGRIGCFLTGVVDGTVGLPSKLPWALDQGDGILRHPTSLYEIFFLMSAWFILKYFDKKTRPQNGDCFRLFVIGYFAFRLFVEFLKPRYSLLFSLSAIQWVSLFGILPYVYYFLVGKRIVSHDR